MEPTGRREAPIDGEIRDSTHAWRGRSRIAASLVEEHQGVYAVFERMKKLALCEGRTASHSFSPAGRRWDEGAPAVRYGTSSPPHPTLSPSGRGCEMPCSPTVDCMP